MGMFSLCQCQLTILTTFLARFPCTAIALFPLWTEKWVTLIVRQFAHNREYQLCFPNTWLTKTMWTVYMSADLFVLLGSSLHELVVVYANKILCALRWLRKQVQYVLRKHIDQMYCVVSFWCCIILNVLVKESWPIRFEQTCCIWQRLLLITNRLILRPEGELTVLTYFKVFAPPILVVVTPL